MRRTALLVLLPVLVACGSTTPGGDPERSPSPSRSAPPAPGPEEPEDASPGAAPARTPACAEVRAGIAAFNAGDFEETVARFEEAVPLAEDQLDGSERAEELLEAVRWYAALPPEDYAEAAVSSPEFQVYKDITLGQCDPVPDGPVASTPPPVQA